MSHWSGRSSRKSAVPSQNPRQILGRQSPVSPAVNPWRDGILPNVDGLAGDKKAQVVIVYDAAGNPVSTFGADPVGIKTILKGTTPAATGLTSTGAGANRQPLDVTIYKADGTPVSSFGTDPVGLKNILAATINPATEDTLALIKAKTDNLNMTLTDLAAALESISAIVSGTVAVSNFPATQPVSAVSLPLPTGASTEATLALIKAKTDNLDIALSALATALESITVQSSVLPTGASTEATLALIKAKTDNLDIALSALATALESITVQSSALPTGAATEATLALIKTKTDNLDITLTALGALLETITVANVTQIGGVAPSALADDESPTPTVPRVGSVMMGMDSAGAANVDRARLSKAHDMDSGAGTEYAVGVTLRKSASGGSLEFGTATDPIRTDPVGTTAQPVSGTVAVSSVIPGTGATNLGKSEDTGHITGDTGVMALGVTNENGGDVVSQNADYTPLITDKSGALRTIGGSKNVSLLVSASRTTTQTGADQTNIWGKGLHVVLDVTVAGTGSITLSIEAKDAVSGKYYAILTGVAVVANGTTVYRLFPGLTAVANATVNDVLPQTWRLVVTHNNANAITYSVGASIIK